jgi:hypothetical protein
MEVDCAAVVTWLRNGNDRMIVYAFFDGTFPMGSLHSTLRQVLLCRKPKYFPLR